jgi:SRSO17 transposase
VNPAAGCGIVGTVKIFLPEFPEKDALPDGSVTKDDLKAWDAEFSNICELISPLFYRTASRAHAVRYLRGLLAPLERKNGWTMSEFTGLREPKALQRFLNLTQWDSDKLRDIVRGYATGYFADSRGVLIADPTGFAKKGHKSAGVQRQYSGTLGRIDNCQIGTFLAYANTSGDRVLIDRELYIPEKSWFGDPDRCAEAGIPEDLAFRTRPQQAEDMIQRALDAGTPFAWFTADEEFGQNPGLRKFLEENSVSYVMAIPRNTMISIREGPSQTIEEAAGKYASTNGSAAPAASGAKDFGSTTGRSSARTSQPAST